MAMLRLVGALLLLVSPVAAAAQTAELTPFAAYRVGGEFVNYSVNDNAAYGGILGVDLSRGVGPGVGLEFLYSHQSTEVTTDLPGLTPRADMKIDQWGLMGFREAMKGQSPARPYGEVGIGLTHLYTEGNGSSTRVNALFGLGVKVFPNPRIGLNLATRGYLAFVSSGSGGFYCGTGGGCSVGFSGSLFFQADLMAGITVKFGHVAEPSPY